MMRYFSSAAGLMPMFTIYILSLREAYLILVEPIAFEYLLRTMLRLLL